MKNKRIIILYKTLASLEKYNGKYEDQDKYLMISKLLLLIYIEVLPILKQWYVEEKDSEEWGIEKYKEFLNNIAQELKGKVENKISSLIH